jgi:nickel/cobalt exporter
VRKLLVLAVLALALLAPAAASAHPLGNFTVNHFSRLQPSGDRIYVLYVLDMAEIPTFQARGEVEAQGKEAYAAGLASRLRAKLSLAVGGRPLALRELEHALAFPPGAGGLTTTRLEIVFEAGPVPAGRPLALSYRDGNFPSRIGWKEIVLAPASGASASSASVPADSISDELRAYPKDLLQSPLDVTEATAEITPGETAGPPPSLLTGSELEAPAHVASKSESGFASLVSRDHAGAGVILLSLLVAMFWGAAHALSPGHGKAIVAAYLVGTRGTARQAVYLGVIVTVTHTIGVFALGLVTLALSELVVPDRLYPWLNLVAALLVVGVGASVLRLRLSDWLRTKRRSASLRDHDHHHDHEHPHDHSHDPDHHHDHDHSHDHDHHHRPEQGMGWRGLLGVGVSGGLLPCPSALVVLLAAISLHRVGYGLVLILAFGVGLAATITGIGLIAVSAKRVFGRAGFQGPLVRLLPAVSALVILAFGVAMTVRAVPALT